MNKWVILFITLSIEIFTNFSNAKNLIEVYHQAKLSNPDILSLKAERDASFEKINEARSPLLPHLILGHYYIFNKGYSDTLTKKNNSKSISIQLTQTLFDMSKWQGLTIQEKNARIQDFVYQNAQQKLMLKTATAYFNILNKLDTFNYTKAKKKVVLQELNQIKKRFILGLVAITDMHNACSQYDNVLAKEVIARNNLDNAIETLRQISGNYYIKLSSLNTASFKTKKLKSIDFLLKEAKDHNLSLLVARLSQDMSREKIRYAETHHMPTLDLIFSHSIINNHYDNDNLDSISGSSQLGLRFRVPLYSGGSVISQVKQARYAFISSSKHLESTYRSMIQNIHAAFNNVNASIRSIKAYKQAVLSSSSSLDAMKKSYFVGTRTIIDVLNAVTMLYDAKQKLANSRYSYMINLLKMQFSIGKLNYKNLLELNNYLVNSIYVLPEKNTEIKN